MFQLNNACMFPNLGKLSQIVFTSRLSVCYHHYILQLAYMQPKAEYTTHQRTSAPQSVQRQPSTPWKTTSPLSADRLYLPSLKIAIRHMQISQACKAIVIASPVVYVGDSLARYMVLPTIPAAAPPATLRTAATEDLAEPMTLFWPKIRIAELLDWQAAIARHVPA